MQGRRFLYRFLMLWVMAAGTGAVMTAQTPFDRVYREEASRIREQVELFSDRSVYAVNETIRFTAVHRVTGPVEGLPWSSVLYVELITSGGQPLVQAKYPLAGGRAEGTLTIPEEALTGDYYLKSYTRWMRNSGPRSFNYVPLKIINPYREEVVMNPEGNGSAAPLPPATFREGILECSLASRRYAAGSEVRLQLNRTSTGNSSPLSCCVTVVPESALQVSPQTLPDAVLEEDSFRVRFLPDLGSGVSISGTVIGPDQLPVPYATLHISILGESPDFFATMSDEQGRFVLFFPEGLAEEQEFFVTPEQDEEGGLEVRIDEEFDSRTVEFPGEPFHLDADEMETARRVALNMQLLRAFRQEPGGEAPDAEPVADGNPVPFYGTRVKRILMDDYVLLPNLTEVFINLVPEIQFYKKKGENRIRFISANKSIDIFSPLIMMDHISIFDHQALLDLSPERIERIDLINEIYLKGNVSFGGVLSIYSRKGDMAGIDLPVGSYFFDYQSFHKDVPVNESPPDQEGRIPDTRNTLFWEGDLQLEPGAPKEVTFRTPAHAGRYVVLVRGMLPGGELYTASTAFEVE